MPIVHPCSLLLENKAFLLQKEKQNIMKTKLLTLLMLFGLFSPLSVYGDDVPTKGGDGMTIIIALSLLLLQHYQSKEIY